MAISNRMLILGLILFAGFVVFATSGGHAAEKQYFILGMVNSGAVTKAIIPPGTDMQTIAANAEKGDREAQFILGNAYIEGNGVTQSDAEALKWWRKAADQGDARAQFDVGQMYEDKQGLQDYAVAMDWYNKSAAHGYAPAQTNLGRMYEHGHGVEKNYAEALKWYNKAAEQGQADAENNLGNLYIYGAGVPQDFAQARKWYQKASAQGNLATLHNIGTLYRYGVGVPQDDSKALDWYLVIAAKGYPFLVAGDIGDLYYQGKGIPKDYAKAYYWLMKDSGRYADKKLIDELSDATAHLAPAQIADLQQQLNGPVNPTPEQAALRKKKYEDAVMYTCMDGTIRGLKDFVEVISKDPKVEQMPDGKIDITGTFTYKDANAAIKTAPFHCKMSTHR